MKKPKLTSYSYFLGNDIKGDVRVSKAKNFDDFFKLCLEDPVLIKCTRAAYMDMPNEEKRRWKKMLPYLVPAVYAKATSSRIMANALYCNLICLDIDVEKDGSCPAAPLVKDRPGLEAAMAPFGFAAYSTISSTKEKPRLRIIVSANMIPLSKYPEAVRTIGDRIGLSVITRESLTPVQPMFMPAIFADECPVIQNPLLTFKEGRAFEVQDIQVCTKASSTFGSEDESGFGADIRFLRSQNPACSIAKAKEVLAFISPDLPYPEWLEIAFGLKHQFSPKLEDEAFGLFDEWSANGVDYPGRRETLKKWRSLKSTPMGRHPITIGTLLKKARDSGWVGNLENVETKITWTTAPNDTGNAEVFAIAFKDQLRFCHTIQEWFAWDGRHWRLNQTRKVYRLAQELSKQALRDAAEIQDEHARKAASLRALSMGNAPKIEAMVRLAQSSNALSVSLEELDNDPAIVGVENGILNLETRTFIQGSRLPYVTKKLGCSYDPSAQCPTWERFLSEVMDGDLALVRFLQASIGYSLTGHTTEHIFWFLWGSGANGKSTLIEILQALAGEYAARTSDSLLALSTNGREPLHELAELPGQRLLLGSEIAENSRLNEKLVKDLTGGDTMRARGLYKQGFSFKPVCKLWMFGNHRPAIGGTDHGIWRRTRMIPFRVQFSGNKVDKTLGAKLRAELPGILNWALDGVLDWSVSGLQTPEAVSKAVEDYRHDEDWLGDFIAECLTPGKTPVSKKAVFETYLRWCECNGHRNPMTTKKLSRRLKDRGFVEKPEKYWQDHSLLRGGRGDVCDEDTAISIDDLF